MLFHLIHKFYKFAEYSDMLQNKMMNACKEKLFRGNIADIVARKIFYGEIIVRDGKIAEIKECGAPSPGDPFFIPGFVDAHVHIESSMMIPVEFARVAMRFGTVGAVCDPHEIANVLGKEGIDFMLENASGSPFCFCFGCPSCVPSCGGGIETAGAVLDSADVAEILERKEIYALSEMMNFPGVLNGDSEVMAKLGAAAKLGKPVDGHAPGLVGEARKKYAQAGISTDHECVSVEEGRDCVKNGMFLLIREGSAARNFEMLSPIIAERPELCMFCTDDCHSSDMVKGHINRLVSLSLERGFDVFDVLRAASYNPVKHYKMPIGLLQVGDSADFIKVDGLNAGFKVLETYIAGENVADCPYTGSPDVLPNVFEAGEISEKDLDLGLKGGDRVAVIGAKDKTLFTEHLEYVLESSADGSAVVPEGIDKIVVYNRYEPGKKPSVALISGFNLKDGAMAVTVAHDCHNIIAVGSDDKALVKAVNAVVRMKGGACALCGGQAVELPLPVAGIMSAELADSVAEKSAKLDEMARKAGCGFNSPFITMSFMALPVIPTLKLTDKGLFDGSRFCFCEVKLKTLQ